MVSRGDEKETEGGCYPTWRRAAGAPPYLPFGYLGGPRTSNSRGDSSSGKSSSSRSSAAATRAARTAGD